MCLTKRTVQWIYCFKFSFVFLLTQQFRLNTLTEVYILIDILMLSDLRTEKFILVSHSHSLTWNSQNVCFLYAIQSFCVVIQKKMSFNCNDTFSQLELNVCNVYALCQKAFCWVLLFLQKCRSLCPPSCVFVSLERYFLHIIFCRYFANSHWINFVTIAFCPFSFFPIHIFRIVSLIILSFNLFAAYWICVTYLPLCSLHILYKLRCKTLNMLHIWIASTSHY